MFWTQYYSLTGMFSCHTAAFTSECRWCAVLCSDLQWTDELSPKKWIAFPFNYYDWNTCTVLILSMIDRNSLPVHEIKNWGDLVCHSTSSLLAMVEGVTSNGQLVSYQCIWYCINNICALSYFRIILLIHGLLHSTMI